MDFTPEAALTSRDDGRYRMLVEAVVDYAIYMLDPDGVITSWNPGAQRFKGFAAAEVVGTHFSRFYTEGDRESGLPERALQIAAAAGTFENEGWRVRKNGTSFWAHVFIDPIRDPSGTLIGFAKITRDLTERRAAAEALKQSEERFSLLVRSVTDYAIYLLDPDGRVSSWNTGAERIKGYTPDEIIGRYYACFHTERDRAAGEPERALAVARRDGRFETEGWRVRKDGREFRASVVIDAIRDDEGRLAGYAKVTRDVTERRNAELALENAREALFQSQKMDAVGQLTGGIAHDFNNLLMAVLGSLEMLKKRLPDDPRAQRLLENAMQGATRGASLTQRMLAFARRQELRLAPVDLPALVGGMIDLFERSIGPSVRIVTDFPPSPSRVTADSHQLELALLNLVMNARDAMPEGGRVVIAARAEEIANPERPDAVAGPHICLSVTDTGLGMDGNTRARATEPFFTTKGVGKGTGLGLSMVHGLAHQSGGWLALESEPGRGTTARIWLPAAGADPVQEPDQAAAQPALPARPLRIVAVDDDSLVLMNTTAMLEDLGHTVVEAESAADALRLLDGSDAFDLVVTDQAMPGMTGTQLIEAARGRRPGLPFVLVSGCAEFPPGTDPTVPRVGKPFVQLQLAQAVAAATEHLRREPPPGRHHGPARLVS